MYNNNDLAAVWEYIKHLETRIKELEKLTISLRDN